MPITIACRLNYAVGQMANSVYCLAEPYGLRTSR